MNLYKPPLPQQYDKSLNGIKHFVIDWIKTPHTTERIVPAWPIDILCGLAFLIPPVLVHFYSA
jgi:hypothetical protein